MNSAVGHSPKTVLILATLDTKQEEARFLKQWIENRGHRVLIVDAGVLEAPSPEPDVSRQQVARAGGESLDEMLRSGDKGRCIANMIRGAAETVRALYDQKRFDGIISVGGAQGAAIGTAAMRRLPFGVPKLMVTTVASGQACFGEYVETSDLAMIHSVVDMFGIHRLSAEILTNAAGAIVGMVEANAGFQYPHARPRIAMTVLGNTTPAGMTIKKLLAEKGYEVVGFHANGTGGVSAEALIAEGYFDAVLDLTAHELLDREFGGKHAAIRDNRLTEASQAGVPQLVVPSCIDYFVFGEPQRVPERFRGRPYVVHNPQITLVRATGEEMAHVAGVMVRRLNAAKGPAAVAIPLRGLSMHNVEGQVFFDPEADRACRDVFRNELRPEVALHEIDAHVNDPAFARASVKVLLELMQETMPKTP
jgi:uncharacterized protein (UPF0261 family)